MAKKKHNFSGWASRNNIKCSDGRTIKKDAFKDQDGRTVPLVWNHEHNKVEQVLGHALLENRDEGLYAYGFFNDTERGRNAKELVEHGDVVSLSIYANRLRQDGANVIHGQVREVSLVLAGANPGAYIETVLSHSDSEEEEAIIFNPSEDIQMYHEDSEDNADNTDDVGDEPAEKEVEKEDGKEIKKEKEKVDENKKDDTTLQHKKDDEKTIKDVFDTLTEEQQNVVYAMIGLALEEKNNNKKEGNEMKQNAFDKTPDDQDNVLSHSEMAEILNEAKRSGSLKDATLAHSITDVEYLFPEARLVGEGPSTINHDTAWVSKIMAAVKKSPFARIKTTAIDITGENARAKGFVKGEQKVEEVIKALKRTTTPTTVYKLQKMDRDDVVDITDFDVVAYIKREMRGKLDEELARAFLIGDGRSASDPDKVNDGNIRPILGDDSLYTIKKIIERPAKQTDSDYAKSVIKSVIKARKEYKGSGNPSFYTTEDMLTEMLLIEDTTGRAIYDSIEKLTTKMRVKEIITVPPMEGVKRVDDSEEFEYSPVGVLVNLSDYTVGANKGGEVNMFDDFDLNFNKLEYLIETRCCGALTVPHSAISFELKTAVVEEQGTEG